MEILHYDIITGVDPLPFRDDNKKVFLKKVLGRNCLIICDQLIDELIFGHNISACVDSLVILMIMIMMVIMMVVMFPLLWT